MLIRLIILALITASSFANAQNITKIKRANHAIYKLDKEIKLEQISIANITKEISKTNYLLTQKRQKLIGENSQFNVTVREIARMARHPKQAQLINDIITRKPPKNAVILQGKKRLVNNLQLQHTEVTSLLEIYAKNQKLLTQKYNEIQNLEKKCLQLHTYQRKLLKSLNISDSSLHKRLTVTRLKLSLSVDSSHLNLKNSHPLKGSIPVAGLVIQNFGEKDSKGVPAFGTSILSTPNAKVKAITAGVVLFNSSYRDYGNMLIIVDSTKRKHLYSGLENSNLQIGDVVKTSATIGFLPNIPEPILYYELRQNGQAQKPEI